MTPQIKLNGIRLNRNMIQKYQPYSDPLSAAQTPLYQVLASGKKNIVFLSLNTFTDTPFITAITDSHKYQRKFSPEEVHDNPEIVSVISVYPHRFNLNLLISLLLLSEKNNLPFRYLTSSHGMLSMIVEHNLHLSFQNMLTTGFDLAETHVPFEQQQTDDHFEFIRRRYPETRSTYEEKKIKTYGIELIENLNHCTIQLTENVFSEFRAPDPVNNKSNQTVFTHASAWMDSSGKTFMNLLTEEHPLLSGIQPRRVDFLRFHGPHFGDRHSISSKALTCLSQNTIPVLQADCSGASMCIVVPAKKGSKAVQTLKHVFDVP